MYEEIKNIKGTARDWLNFGAGAGIVIVAVAGIKFWKSDEEFWLYLTLAGAGVMAVAVLLPGIFRFYYRIWMIMALLIGWVMTRVLLTASFFLVLTPVALLLRITGKRVLALTSDSSADSYWEKRSVAPADTTNIRERYEQQF